MGRHTTPHEIQDLVRSSDHPVTAAEVARRVRIGREQAAVHLRQLERAGLVTKDRKRGARRGSWPYLYSARPTAHLLAEKPEHEAHRSTEAHERQDDPESWWAALDRRIREVARERATREKRRANDG